MNDNINKAICEVAKAKALLYVMERAFSEVEVVPKDADRAVMGWDVHYVLVDIVDSLQNSIQMAAKDICALERCIGKMEEDSSYE